MRKEIGRVIALVVGWGCLLVLSPTAAVAETVTFQVSGRANLYQQTNPETRSGSIDPVRVPQARLCPSQQIQIIATGCVVDFGPRCTGPEGIDSIFRGLPVYSLVGRWSRSPDVLDNSTVASGPFFVGSAAVLAAPSTEGEYYLFLGENDGVFSDNSGAYTVTATWTQLPTCLDTGNPQVTTMSPNKGGDTGSVSVLIHGSHFADGATAKLMRAGQSDIVGDPVGVGKDGRTVATTFDLTGKARGLWDVVVTNPNGISAMLPGAFTIEEGRAAQVWVDIVGRDTVRIGRVQPVIPINILYGNRGNVDAVGVPIWITGIPKDASLKVNFGFIAIPLPQGIEGPGQPPLFFETDEEKAIPLVIRTIPPGFTGVLNIELILPIARQFQLKAFVVAP